MSSASTTSPACHFDRLPNELQDFVFAHLGWELTAFTKHRLTRASATKALWSFFCREMTRPTPHTTDVAKFDKQVLKLLSKPKFVLDHICRWPDAELNVREITFVVPASRVEYYPDGDEKTRVAGPGTWLSNEPLLNVILAMLGNVRKLRLITLWIPRDEPSTNSFRTIPNSYKFKVKIPLHIKELHIEETYTPDTVTFEAMDYVDANILVDYKISHTTDQLAYCDCVEFLHIKNFSLPYSDFNFIGRCEALKEICLELSWLDCGADLLLLSLLFEELVELSHLRTVDLRMPYDPEEYPGDQLFALITQVRTFRIPLLWFPEFLKISSPATDIHFELCYDRDQAFQDFGRTQGARWMILGNGRAEHAKAVSRDMDAAVKVIKLVGEFFDQQRQGGVIEKRSVTAVSCVWATNGLGLAWCDDGNWTTEVLCTALNEVDGFGAYFKSVAQKL